MSFPVKETNALPNGEDISVITLSGFGLTAQLLSFGATLRDLRLDGYAHSLVLGYQNIADYLENPLYLGNVVGPVANRIGNARFDVSGKTFQLDANAPGGHTLHGGRLGTSHLNWTVVAVSATSATFSLRLENGHMGFPGPIEITTCYQLLENTTLDVSLSANVAQACPINLASHCYFNLDGSADICAHQLELDAARVVHVDSMGIPTGKTPDVTGTEFDFRSQKPVGRADIDINYCLSDTKTALRPVATLHGAEGAPRMKILTDQPGLQVFNASAIETEALRQDGTAIGPYAGIAFEPQNWPDAPNRDHFPNSIVTPQETYSSHSQFQFR